MVDLKKDEIIHRFDISLSKSPEEIKKEFEDKNNDGQGDRKSDN
jgi:hypothetical protein